MQVSAVVFAGGSGKRMKINTLPKQFMELDNKPIIIYTLEHFEKHPQIDSIAVVCIAGWIDYLKEKLNKFGIKKVKWIVEGGNSGQESIFNGLNAIYQDCSDPSDTIVLIHDGVRPLINGQVITDNIECVKASRTAITVTPAIETIMNIDAQSGAVKNTMDRHSCMMARAPQSFYLQDIYNAHLRMQQEQQTNMIDSATIMEACGYQLHIVTGPAENIKITTPTDFYEFQAFHQMLKEEQ